MQPHFVFDALTDEEKEIIEEMKKDKFLMDNLELIVRGVLTDEINQHSRQQKGDERRTKINN